MAAVVLPCLGLVDILELLLLLLLGSVWTSETPCVIILFQSHTQFATADAWLNSVSLEVICLHKDSFSRRLNSRRPNGVLRVPTLSHG